MNIEKYAKLHERLCKKALQVSRVKGHDYSGKEDTLRNLKMTAAFGVMTSEQGVLVRLGDKLSRLWQLVGRNSKACVSNESVHDTIVDLINYSVLLYALIEDEKE